ncbi:MAG TPA: sulfite exporter TauE/SafE family protein [Vicinamibacterales bacterium]|nr:sulfite exporter TauE/SafE family protein [Vicinamibacterales bacterium]
MHAADIYALAAGGLAGCLGALVGIGGGVLLVPILNSIVGLPFTEATAVSLVGVLATSSTAGLAHRGLLNARLAILLLFFSVSGSTLGAGMLTRFPESTYKLVFGATAALIAGIMFVRLNKRNVLPVDSEPGVLGARFHDHDTGGDVVYRVTRVPVAAAVSFGAGMLTSLVGIGGGILIVPTLNSLCGVPLRAAAATSVLMIGVTAVPSLAAHWSHGFLGDFHFAGMTAVGVLMGFQVGLRLSPRAPVHWLKLIMAAILAIVAAKYLIWR